MKRFLATLLVAGACLGGVSTAQAASGVPGLSAMPSGDAVTLVSEGCGPGGFRDRFGYCRPRRPPVRFYCRPGFHPTPYGCRPNY